MSIFGSIIEMILSMKTFINKKNIYCLFLLFPVLLFGQSLSNVEFTVAQKYRNEVLLNLFLTEFYDIQNTGQTPLFFKITLVNKNSIAMNNIKLHMKIDINSNTVYDGLSQPINLGTTYPENTLVVNNNDLFNQNYFSMADNQAAFDFAGINSGFLGSHGLITSGEIRVTLELRTSNGSDIKTPDSPSYNPLIFITCYDPAPPRPITPFRDEDIVGAPLTQLFGWTPISCLDGKYRLRFWETESESQVSFLNPILDEFISSDELQFQYINSAGLIKEGKTYIWEVLPYDKHGNVKSLAGVHNYGKFQCVSLAAGSTIQLTKKSTTEEMKGNQAVTKAVLTLNTTLNGITSGKISYEQLNYEVLAALMANYRDVTAFVDGKQIPLSALATAIQGIIDDKYDKITTQVQQDTPDSLMEVGRKAAGLLSDQEITAITKVVDDNTQDIQKFENFTNDIEKTFKGQAEDYSSSIADLVSGLGLIKNVMDSIMITDSIFAEINNKDFWSLDDSSEYKSTDAQSKDSIGSDSLKFERDKVSNWIIQLQNKKAELDTVQKNINTVMEDYEKEIIALKQKGEKELEKLNKLLSNFSDLLKQGTGPTPEKKADLIKNIKEIIKNIKDNVKLCNAKNRDIKSLKAKFNNTFSVYQQGTNELISKLPTSDDKK